MSRRGHRDDDGDWIPPRPREVGRITSGSLTCRGCAHGLALHPGREGCNSCGCVWFQEGARPANSGRIRNKAYLRKASVSLPVTKAEGKQRKAPRPEPRNRRMPKRVSLSLPVVMGQGRQLWNDLLAGGHTWGGKVTVSKGGPTRSPARANGPKVSSASTQKRCSICNCEVLRGEVIVPIAGIGPNTKWGHKRCAAAR
jgi:hypothetical protein